jgi:hypothetical protein
MTTVLEKLAHRHLERRGNLLESRSPHVYTIALGSRDCFAVQAGPLGDVGQTHLLR